MRQRSLPSKPDGSAWRSGFPLDGYFTEVREGWTVAPPCFALGPDGLQRLPLEKRDDTMQSGA